MPVFVLLGAKGAVQRWFRPLGEWRQLAADVRGPLPCRHFIAEEAPDQLLAEVLPFLTSGDGT